MAYPPPAIRSAVIPCLCVFVAALWSLALAAPIEPPNNQETEFEAPPAVAPTQRMKHYPAAGEFIAFSLRAAEQTIKAREPQRDDWLSCPEIFSLAGINRVHGLVYDRKSADLILVGKHDAKHQALTLDDLAVALRARFVEGKWPLVSIDPAHDMLQTGLQNVRFEGGIQETQFGADLLDADYKLKRIGMGLLPAGVSNFVTYWDLGFKRRGDDAEERWSINSRFWFYPILPNVSVRADVVVCQGLKVGVFTETLSAEINGRKVSGLANDENAAEFAEAFSRRFDELAIKHPSISRLQGLDELVALTRALEEMDDRPSLDFWLSRYSVARVATPKHLKALTRNETTKDPGTRTMTQRSLHGGVQLMAIALRLNSGDTTALKDAVTKSRPAHDALSWTFLVTDWVIPTASRMLGWEDLPMLYSQADFLREQNRLEEALIIYQKVIDLLPDEQIGYLNRGIAYLHMDGKAALATQDFDKVIALNPKNAEAYHNRGVCFEQQSDYHRAVADYSAAIKLNPAAFRAYYHRARVRYNGARAIDEALSDYSKAIELKPDFADAWLNRGVAYFEGKQDLTLALRDFDKAIALRPESPAGHFNRGNVCLDQDRLDDAILSYGEALRRNPQYADAYLNRGLAHKRAGKFESAINDFSDALNLRADDIGELLSTFREGAVVEKPRQRDPETSQRRRRQLHLLRGMSYLGRGDGRGAIPDFDECIRQRPSEPKFFYARSIAHFLADNIATSLMDLNKAWQIDTNAVNDALENDFNEAIRRLESKDFQSAVAILSRLSTWGYVEAQVHLADLYHEGHGTRKDSTEAAKWLSIAAARGNTLAQNRLGILYLSGDGVDRDRQRGLAILTAAATNGSWRAQFNLGTLYRYGVEATPDYDRMLKWYMTAADNGVVVAQTQLGGIYQQGEGVPCNLKMAAHWYARAATNGDVKAQIHLGLLYARGNGVPRNTAAAQQWWQKAADSGSRLAATNLLRLGTNSDLVSEPLDRKMFLW
jgi:TPR repeat protein